MDLHAVVICYDVCSKSSFQSLPFWLKEIKENGYEDLELIICGNKIDKGSKRLVKEREVAQFARSRGVNLIEVSAKDGTNVKEMFLTLAKKII